MLRYRDFPLLAGVCIAIYFLTLVGPSVNMHFAPDDMQNLFTYWNAGTGKVIAANLLFATSFYRPLAAAYYLPLYQFFGFHPLPYRIVMLLLATVNVWLLYRLARRILRSGEGTAFAVLFACLHSSVMAVYYSNAMIYEVLCFLFLTGTFLHYLRIRQDGRTFSWRELALLAILYACALNSKEMAVVLPAILALYELTAGGPITVNSLRQRLPWRPLLLTGTMAVVYTLGKMMGADSLSKIEGYRPTYTLDRFLQTSGVYIGDLLCSAQPLNHGMTILFWTVLIALAALFRNRHMLFGAGFAFLSFLPLNFVPPRQGFVLYIPLIGFGIYAGGLLVAILDRLPLGIYRPQIAAVLFTMVLASLSLLYAPRAAQDANTMLHAQESTWNVLQEFDRLHPRIQRGAKVLLADSPIESGWDLYFIAKLYFRDHSLRAGWVRSKENIVYGDVHENFDHEFRFEGVKLRQVK